MLLSPLDATNQLSEAQIIQQTIVRLQEGRLARWYLRISALCSLVVLVRLLSLERGEGGTGWFDLLIEGALLVALAIESISVLRRLSSIPLSCLFKSTGYSRDCLLVSFGLITLLIESLTNLGKVGVMLQICWLAPYSFRMFNLWSPSSVHQRRSSSGAVYELQNTRL